MECSKGINSDASMSVCLCVRFVWLSVYVRVPLYIYNCFYITKSNACGFCLHACMCDDVM